MPEGREECRKRKVARRPGRAQRGAPPYGGYSPIYVEGRESLRSKPAERSDQAERSEVLLLTERGAGGSLPFGFSFLGVL